MAAAMQETPPATTPTETTIAAEAPAIEPNKLLKRACDCCRKRKVKCDGSDPCPPCKRASIRCAYLQPPKKKGPKGLRSQRVLHALRRIDDSGVQPTTSSLSPRHGTFGNWSWGANSAAPVNHAPMPAPYNDHVNMRPMPEAGIPQSGIALEQPVYYQHQPMPPPTAQRPPPAIYRPELHQQQSWMLSQADSISSTSDGHRTVTSPTSAADYHNQRKVSGEAFLPFVHLFYNHMFPIMPVIDRTVYLDPALYTNPALMTPEVYSFLCALCAATIVQLDDSIAQPPPLHPIKRSDDLLAEECLRERRTFDYIDTDSTLGIMTSFFLFAYYGNHEQHVKAWHYLQESITLAENMSLDDEAAYAKLDPVELQWRRRLYWLLFITERAYAVQRRRHTRLRASVTLPAVFESEDPQLLSGFVNLANLFSSVDETFVSAWRGSRRASLCDEAWLAQTQKQIDATARTVGLGEMTETQHLDISVTREWLHVLAWQMGVSNGLIWAVGEGGMRLDYPVELARKVVQITASANALALDSHGIGMEQKLSDIAGCLADVLKCTAGDTSSTFLEGKQYLHNLLQKLSSMRGKESRYLRPLLCKMEGLLGYELGNATLPLPSSHPHPHPPQVIAANHLHVPQQLFAPTSTHRWSMADSVGMLRTLSMNGSLGMPGIAVAHEDWQMRRPSGRVLEEEDWRVDGLDWRMEQVL